MVIIFGGAYQGKLLYAQKNYDESNLVFNCTDKTAEIDFSYNVINSFHLFILCCVKNNINAVTYIEQNIVLFKHKIIICDDISSGVVPINKQDRIWREAVGRSMAILANNADEVVRIFCGIGCRIK